MTQLTAHNPPLSSAPNAALGWSRLPADYAIPSTPPTLAEAREYCAHLARTHYENFSVASWFLPRRLRQHFFNLYAYCRISDDLGDEVGDPVASLAATTKISPSPAGSFLSAYPSIFSMSTPTAASPTISATKSATPPPPSNCSTNGSPNSTPATPEPRVIPSS